jgi:hypothetical protein
MSMTCSRLSFIPFCSQLRRQFHNQLQMLGPIAVLVLMTFSTAEAFSDTSIVNGVGDFRREMPAVNLLQSILGPVCYSLPSTHLDLACNPAFLAREEKTQLRASLTINDRVGDVNDYRTKLEAGDSIGIVNQVLAEHDPMIARATSAIWYQRDWWAIGVLPFRGGFATNVQNPAYPRVAADIYKQSEVFGKAGFLVAGEPKLEVGFQLRYDDTQFFRREFDVLDVIGDPGQLSIESQRALYLEPGINYAFDSAWDSAVSATLTQGAIYQSGAQDGFMPVFDLGFRTAPPFAGGHLVTSTHFNNNPALPDLFSRFLWGAVYDFEKRAAVAVSLGKTVAGVGVMGHYDSVELALGWKTEQVSPDQWQATRVSTLMLEAGLVF